MYRLTLLAWAAGRRVVVQQVIDLFFIMDIRLLYLLQLLVHEVTKSPVVGSMILQDLLVANEARPVVGLLDFFFIRLRKVVSDAFVAEHIRT